MIQIVKLKKFSDINILDIYDIIDIYNNSFNDDSINGHNNCLCQKHFNKSCKIEVKNKKIESIQVYLLKHFEKMNDIKNIMSMFHQKYPQINWLMEQTVHLEGNESFKVYRKFNLIGYDDNNVVICYLKPQFNALNYNEVLMNSIFDTHLIMNVKKMNKDNEITENYKRFYGKKVITCIFTLDRNEPYYIDWYDLIISNKENITNSIYKVIMEKYNFESNNIFYFYSYWRKFCPDNDRKPSDFIRFLKEQLDVNLPVLPLYIGEFISQIEWEIQNSKGKTNKELILKNYDDKDYFTEKIEKILDISVKRYLKMDIIEDDDEDDDE